MPVVATLPAHPGQMPPIQNFNNNGIAPAGDPAAALKNQQLQLNMALASGANPAQIMALQRPLNDESSF
jgi:hypothetical protein